ncbi:MAG: AmmeMemoRadiSam system radical SAM enzyme [Xanthomonadales bacterium]|nr:AmmeMemoRadiSam system radical SAM enzyme [Xanthomonadales bacterium]
MVDMAQPHTGSGDGGRRAGPDPGTRPRKPGGERLTGVAGRYWHRLDDERLQCDLCPRFCKLRDGQRGLCFVRGRAGGQILLTTYGRSSGFCIDPIEKKPLNHFLPGTSVLSFGTAGCNLACKFCQNWDISKSREFDRLQARASPRAIAEVAVARGSRSVAFTYNDPVIFLEYAVDTARACRERGIRTVAVTAGYITPKAREEFFACMDAANIDLKAFSERFYHKLCGGHLEPVLDTLKYLKNDTQVWFEITCLLIPGENDSDAEIDAMSAWIRQELGPDVPLHLTAFHPDWKLRNRPRTPISTLRRAREIARGNGLRYVYTGNVLDPKGASTACHRCGQTLVGRTGYDLTGWRLDVADGAACCSRCRTPLPGLFDERPGRWGSRREAVHVRH